MSSTSDIITQPVYITNSKLTVDFSDLDLDYVCDVNLGFRFMLCFHLEEKKGLTNITTKSVKSPEKQLLQKPNNITTTRVLIS